MSLPTPDEKPPEPCTGGRNGHWVKLGEVSVDSSQIVIVDPTYIDKSARANTYLANGIASPYNKGVGVQLMAGFGDGGYDVWAWVVDTAVDEDETDERIAQIVMTLIDEKELKNWRLPPGLPPVETEVHEGGLYRPFYCPGSGDPRCKSGCTLDMSTDPPTIKDPDCFR